MTARLDAARWPWIAGLAFVASLLGLLAGTKPGLAVAAAAGTGFVLLVFTNLTPALAIFCAEPLRLDFSASKGVRIAAALLLVSWLGTMVSREDSEGDFLSAHAGISMVCALFVGWSVLSATWAEIPNATLIPDGGYALGVIIILITFTAVRTRNQALLVAAFFVAGAAAAAVYGMISPPAAPADTAEGARLSNPFLDPNELASFLVAGGALSIGVAQFAKRSPGLRMTAYGAGALCLVGILLSASRGGLVAVGMALVAAVLFSGRWRARMGILAGTVALVAVFYFAALAPQHAKERILDPNPTGSTRGTEGRRTIWQIGWRLVKANPVRGVGSGNFITSTRHYLLQPGTVFRSDEIIGAPKVAHNTYLQIQGELGIIGLTLYMIIIAFSLRSTLLAARNFARRGDDALEALARTLAIAVIGLLAANFFISQPFDKQLWLLLGLGPAMLAISKRSGANDARTA